MLKLYCIPVAANYISRSSSRKMERIKDDFSCPELARLAASVLAPARMLDPKRPPLQAELVPIPPSCVRMHDRRKVYFIIKSLCRT